MSQVKHFLIYHFSKKALTVRELTTHNVASSPLAHFSFYRIGQFAPHKVNYASSIFTAQTLLGSPLPPKTPLHNRCSLEASTLVGENWWNLATKAFEPVVAGSLPWPYQGAEGSYTDLRQELRCSDYSARSFCCSSEPAGTRWVL